MNTFSYDPLLLPRIVIWTMLTALLIVTSADPDLWGHVKFGLDIIRDGKVHSSDSYSFTSDVRWINHEWLAEVLMGTAYSLAGSVGLVVLKVSVLVTAFAMVVLEARRRGVPPLVCDGLALTTALACLMLTKTLRPQTFSLMLFCALLTCASRAEEGRTRWLWCLPPLFGVWANLHGGWIVGGGVLALWTATLLVSKRARSVGQTWVIFGVLSLLATLANPYGPGLWQFLATTVSIDRADITEWLPVTALPPEVWATWLVVSAVAAWSATAGAQTWPRRVTVLLLAILSFRVGRITPFFAMAVATLLVPGRLLRPHRSGPVATGAAAIGILLTFAVVAVGVSVETARRSACITSRSEWVPDAAAAAVIRTLPGARLITPFNWGQYAIWHFAPRVTVSMDGRRETVYSAARLTEHGAMLAGGAQALERVARLQADLVWLPTGSPLLEDLRDSGWTRVYASAQSEVYAARAGVVLAPPLVTGPRCFPD